MDKLKVFIACLSMVITLVGCGEAAAPEPTAVPTPTPQPTATPTPEPTSTAPPIPGWEGWEKFEGGGVQLWLPGSYEGGDLSDHPDVVVESLRSLGPDFEDTAQMIEQNSSEFVFWAFDLEIGDSGLLTTVSVGVEQVPSDLAIDAYLDTVMEQLSSQFREVKREIVPLGHYEAGQIVVESSVSGVDAKQIMQAIKDGSTIWVVNYSTGASEFDERLPDFERSIRTFTIQP